MSDAFEVRVVRPPCREGEGADPDSAARTRRKGAPSGKGPSALERQVRGEIAGYLDAMPRRCQRCGRIEPDRLITRCLCGLLCPACLGAWLETLHRAEQAAVERRDTLADRAIEYADHASHAGEGR